MAYLKEHSFHSNSVNSIDECIKLLKLNNINQLIGLAESDVKSAIAVSYFYAASGQCKEAGIYARKSLILDGRRSDSIDEISALEELAYHSSYGTDGTFKKAATNLSRIARDTYLKSIRHD